MNMARTRRLAGAAIGEFQLDLRGLVVLTEAATGHFALTAPLAALAGAEKVCLLARDSRHGTAGEGLAATLRVAEAWGVQERLQFLPDRQDNRLAEAHVITNLGMLRPLDREFLSRLGPYAAVPLMWETWEFRPEDLDIRECWRVGIPVLGTNEKHPALQTFRHVGIAVAKLLLEAGVEVLRSRIALVGSGGFCPQIFEALRTLGAEVVQVEHPRNKLPPELDAVVVAEHGRREVVLGLAPLENLATASPGVVIAHVCGAVDWEAVLSFGIDHVPAKPAPVGYMSITADYAGPRALIDLHAAGLKVGADLAKARLCGTHGLDAELAVLAACPFAQGFAGRHPGHATPKESA